MYIQRHAEETIKKMEKSIAAILVTGSRQIGKTTLLQSLTTNKHYLSLEDPFSLQSAMKDAENLFRISRPPVIVDEIQHAPNLFPAIKTYIDQKQCVGQFFLSSSQTLGMIENLSEWLTEHLGVVQLLGISLREKNNVSYHEPFVPTKTYFKERGREKRIELPYADIWPTIHRGCMPELVTNPSIEWSNYYDIYINTYIKRDVPELASQMLFVKFMQVLASRTGELLNLTTISREVGISIPIAVRWLSVLIASNQIYLLQPYCNDEPEQAFLPPKVYFLDTGLVAYLTGWNEPEALKMSGAAEQFFKTFVIAEIIKSYTNAGRLDLPLYYYQDEEENEIDLLVYKDGKLHPVMIKNHSTPRKDEIAAFSLLEELPGAERGTGGLICLYEQLVDFGNGDKVIPLAFL